MLLKCNLPDLATPATNTAENLDFLLIPTWFCYKVTSVARPCRYFCQKGYCMCCSCSICKMLKWQWWGYLNIYCWTVRTLFADAKEESRSAQTPAGAEVIYPSFQKPLENSFSFVAQKSLRLKNRWSNTLWFRSKVCFTAINTTKWVILIFFLSMGMACKHIFPCSLSPLYGCCTFPAAFSSIAYTLITVGHFRALGSFWILQPKLIVRFLKEI